MTNFQFPNDQLWSILYKFNWSLVIVSLGIALAYAQIRISTSNHPHSLRSGIDFVISLSTSDLTDSFWNDYRWFHNVCNDKTRET